MGHKKNSAKVTANAKQDDKSSKISKTTEACAFSQNSTKKK